MAAAPDGPSAALKASTTSSGAPWGKRLTSARISGGKRARARKLMAPVAPLPVKRQTSVSGW